MKLFNQCDLPLKEKDRHFMLNQYYFKTPGHLSNEYLVLCGNDLTGITLRQDATSELRELFNINELFSNGEWQLDLIEKQAKLHLVLYYIKATFIAQGMLDFDFNTILNHAFDFLAFLRHVTQIQANNDNLELNTNLGISDFNYKVLLMMFKNQFGTDLKTFNLGLASFLNDMHELDSFLSTYQLEN